MDEYSIWSPIHPTTPLFHLSQTFDKNKHTSFQTKIQPKYTQAHKQKKKEKRNSEISFITLQI